MTPPTTIMMSGRPTSASASRSAGTSVRCPAASDDTPTTCTSLSTACRATSSGVGEQRADVDVEAEVGEGGGDHLLAAVVAVLAHLGDQDARPAAVGLGELLDQFALPSLDVARPSPPRRGRRRRWCGSRPGAGRRPSPARRRSRRRWPWPGPRRSPAPAGCCPARPSPAGRAPRRGSARPARPAWPPRRARPRSCSSLASCSARTRLLSTLSTSISSVLGRPGTC